MARFDNIGQLNEAVMPGQSFKECKKFNKKHYDSYVVPEYNFCAGHVNGTTVKIGDSGGGLVFNRSGNWFVRGIVSIAINSYYGEMDVTKFDIFTNVQSYFEWIYKNMGNPVIKIEEDCPKLYI